MLGLRTAPHIFRFQVPDCEIVNVSGCVAIVVNQARFAQDKAGEVGFGLARASVLKSPVFVRTDCAQDEVVHLEQRLLFGVSKFNGLERIGASEALVGLCVEASLKLRESAKFVAFINQCIAVIIWPVFFQKPMKNQLKIHPLEALRFPPVLSQIMIESHKVYQKAVKQKLALADQIKGPMDKLAMLFQTALCRQLPLRFSCYTKPPFPRAKFGSDALNICLGYDQPAYRQKAVSVFPCLIAEQC